MDFICPYCYLGKHRLNEALKLVELSEPVELIYHSYELHPRARYRSGKLVPQWIAERHGISLAAAEASVDELYEQGQELGISILLRSAPVTNTHDAHRVAHLALNESPKLAQDFAEQLFRTYFTESRDIGDPAILVEAAVESGLDRDQVVEVLVSDAFESDVRRDIELAADVHLQGVPHFMVNDRYPISGAQAPRTIAAALKRALDEE